MIGILLPSITTNPKFPWAEKIEEAKELGIEEIALFPTFIKAEERKILFDTLSKSTIKRIPYVHLRHDFTREEIEFLINNFGTKKFNIHQEDADREVFRDYSDLIYIENKRVPFDDDILKDFAGICLDLAHHYDGLYNPKTLRANISSHLESYPIGFCHFSGIEKNIPNKESGLWDIHKISEFYQLNYIKEIDQNHIKEVVFELNNSLHEQLEAIKYLEKYVGIRGEVTV